MLGAWVVIIVALALLSKALGRDARAGRDRA
jgi:hypothetical protein